MCVWISRGLPLATAVSSFSPGANREPAGSSARSAKFTKNHLRVLTVLAFFAFLAVDHELRRLVVQLGARTDHRAPVPAKTNVTATVSETMMNGEQTGRE